jgi:predicted Rossmann fold nucleotide-binding protein DprA/Smf involved in DNA uptake
VLDALGVERSPPPLLELGEEAKLVLERLREFAAGADELQRTTGLDAAALAAALTELELAGAAIQEGGVFRAGG